MLFTYCREKVKRSETEHWTNILFFDSENRRLPPSFFPSMPSTWPSFSSINSMQVRYANFNTKRKIWRRFSLFTDSIKYANPDYIKLIKRVKPSIRHLSHFREIIDFSFLRKKQMNKLSGFWALINCRLPERLSHLSWQLNVPRGYK